jgi:hypothetical protein
MLEGREKLEDKQPSHPTTLKKLSWRGKYGDCSTKWLFEHQNGRRIIYMDNEMTWSRNQIGQWKATHSPRLKQARMSDSKIMSFSLMLKLYTSQQPNNKPETL